jgi:tetratricopeptide (TPR) repeat protein
MYFYIQGLKKPLMSQNPNKLIKFWQELMRRRVFNVVTTYAATAYIIIEVTNNLVQPLSLPAWIAKLVILLLGAGLPVVVILSWIFDFTPQGIKKTESQEVLESKEIVIKPVKRKLRAGYVLNAILILVVIVLAYPKIFKRNTLEKLRSSGERISVAVMPFGNMTNDTIWDVWQNGIQDMLINSLSNSEELRVRQIESVKSLIQGNGITNYASITPSVASEISQKLDADVFLYGNLKKAGSTLRVCAQLINSNTGEIFKTFQIEGSAQEEMIFPYIDSLSTQIRNFLVISKLEKEVSPDFQDLASTNSPEAYRYFNSGNIAFSNKDFPTAVNLLEQAIDIDSNFISAILIIPFAFGNQGLYENAKKWSLKAYEKRNQMTMRQKVWTNRTYANYFETPTEDIKYLRQLLKFDDQLPWPYFNIGNDYNELQLFDKAVIELEKSLDIYKKWESKPMWVWNYTRLGYSYHKLGEYKKENKLYKKAQHDFPDDPDLLYRQAILALSEGKAKEAIDIIEKYKSIRKENSASEADIATSMGLIYSEADILDRAEDYYRQALSLESENLALLNKLAWFLIDNDRNINEGLELVIKALKVDPDNYLFLETKGLGLFKQGKYQEALDIFQKSWELRREKAVYNHEAFLHLEAARKAVAIRKNN